MEQRFKVKHLPMAEEDQRQWARQYAKIVLDIVEKKFGRLPPPPSDEEFHRLWDEIVKSERPS